MLSEFGRARKTAFPPPPRRITLCNSGMWLLQKPTETASFASFSMWPSLCWGLASRGSGQRHVPRTSQALTWLFFLLLFWMLLDHREARAPASYTPHATGNVVRGDGPTGRQPESRATLLGTRGKQYNQGSCQRGRLLPKATRWEKGFNIGAAGGPWVRSPSFSRSP